MTLEQARKIAPSFLLPLFDLDQVGSVYDLRELVMRQYLETNAGKGIDLLSNSDARRLYRFLNATQEPKC